MSNSVSVSTYNVFIVLFLLFILSIIGNISVAEISVMNMDLVYQKIESFIYSDGNAFSYTVEWYYASGYVNGELRHYYVGFVRGISDAGEGSNNVRWYVDSIEPKFRIMYQYQANLVDLDPANPIGCVSSWSGGVSVAVSLSRDGAQADVGASYSVTVDPYRLSIHVPSSYPSTKWVFDPCIKLYGGLWKSESLVMYVAGGQPSVSIEHLVGSTFSKEVRHCLVGGHLCWWEYDGGTGHYHLWQITLNP